MQTILSEQLREDELFGVRYAVTDLAEAVPYIADRLASLAGGYICFSNVHTLVTAIENTRYRKALNGSAVTFPDGAPVASRLRRKGNATARRVAGPDFTEKLIEKTSDGRTRHFFCGSTEAVLDRLTGTLKKRYPDISIAGCYAPPFRDQTAEEDEKLSEMIEEAGADIIWVGLGAPKQELFMATHKGRFRGVMIGVGAAFDFISGNKKRAPKLMQRLHLEWLYRMIREPGRLSGRYIITNTKYIRYCLTGRG